MQKYKALGEMLERSEVGGGEWVKRVDADQIEQELIAVKALNDKYHAALVQVRKIAFEQNWHRTASFLNGVLL